MSEESKSGPWVIVRNIFMVVGLLSFLGFSIIPFVGVYFEQSPTQASSVSGSPQNNKTEAQNAEVEARARGYELVLEREPENLTALRGLLEARLELKDIKGAIAPLEKLAKLQPEETDYAVLLAQAKQKVGDREGAAQAYRSVLASQPGERNALQGMVSLLLEEQRPEAAIGLLEDTLKTANQANQVKPGSVDSVAVQLMLGQVYADQKRYDEAIALYDEVTTAHQQDFRPVLGKAIVLKEQGKTTEAEPLFATAAALAPAQYKDQINKLAGTTAQGGDTKPDTAASPNSAAPKTDAPLNLKLEAPSPEPTTPSKATE